MVKSIRPTCTAGGPGHDSANDQAAMSKRAAFQFHGDSSPRWMHIFSGVRGERDNLSWTSQASGTALGTLSI